MKLFFCFISLEKYKNMSVNWNVGETNLAITGNEIEIIDLTAETDDTQLPMARSSTLNPNQFIDLTGDDDDDDNDGRPSVENSLIPFSDDDNDDDDDDDFRTIPRTELADLMAQDLEQTRRERENAMVEDAREREKSDRELAPFLAAIQQLDRVIIADQKQERIIQERERRERERKEMIIQEIQRLKRSQQDRIDDDQRASKRRRS